MGVQTYDTQFTYASKKNSPLTSSRHLIVELIKAAHLPNHSGAPKTMMGRILNFGPSHPIFNAATPCLHACSLVEQIKASMHAVSVRSCICTIQFYAWLGYNSTNG